MNVWIDIIIKNSFKLLLIKHIKVLAVISWTLSSHCWVTGCEKVPSSGLLMTRRSSWTGKTWLISSGLGLPLCAGCLVCTDVLACSRFYCSNWPEWTFEVYHSVTAQATTRTLTKCHFSTHSESGRGANVTSSHPADSFLSSSKHIFIVRSHGVTAPRRISSTGRSSESVLIWALQGCGVDGRVEYWK